MKASLVILVLEISSLLVVELAARPTHSTSATSSSDGTDAGTVADLVAGAEASSLENFNTLPTANANYKKRTRDEDEDDDELMQTAETYFRPLSRYRDLQEKKKKQHSKHTDNEVAAAAAVPVSVKPNAVHAHDRTLSSIKPEYCLPVKNGVVCYYKV